MEELDKYKKKCLKYETKIKDQKIVIKALTNLINNRRISQENFDGSTDRLIEKNEYKNISISNETSNLSIKDENNMGHINDLQTLTENRKKNESTFVVNFSFLQFIQFCANSQLKPQDVKNIKNYVKNNKKGLIRYIFRNINVLTIFEVYETFWLMSHYLADSERLIIIHDIFLFTDKKYKIVPFTYAIIRNSNCFTGVFGETCKLLIGYQMIYQKNNYINEKLQNYYTQIDKDLDLKGELVDLNQYLKNLLVAFDVFENGEINKNLIKHSLCIRVLLSTMDQEYVFDHFIKNFLLIKLKEHPSMIFYFGVFTVNFLRMTGRDEKLCECIKILEEFLNCGNEEKEILAYIFVNQISFEHKRDWLKKIQEYSKLESVNMEYMEKLII
ncbi:hypothetical protein COBT_001299 [Conglomerata obtusa]